MPVPPTPQNFDGARRDVGLSQGQLWMRYFALGGAAMPTEFEAFVVGALDPSPGEHDILGSDRRWHYAGDDR
jgi:hypothetical protein